MKKKLDLSMILAAVHFLLSFFYERLVLIFKLEQDIVASRPMNQFVSDGAERILAYIMSKFLAFVMIYFIWKLLFFVVAQFRRSRLVRTYVVVFMVGLVLLSFLWPTRFLTSRDNVITYSYAIRLLPEYWHNAYSSYVYCAALMVFPHPAAISFLQWLFFVFGAGYASYRIENSAVLRGRGKWLPVLLVLVPRISTLVTDGYRTEQYAIAAIIYITLVAMDVVDHRERTTFEMIEILLFSAFVSVWRTEGIIVGALSVVVLFFWGYRLKWKKATCYMAGFLAAFLLVNFANKIGDIKYYGKDYSIVNSFSTLQNILNDPVADLDYFEAVDDLLAIEAVTPIDAIQLYGLEGYRRYNVMCGRADINQSMAGKEATKAFLKGYRSLLFHNLNIYVKTQFSMLASIWGLEVEEYGPAPIIEDTGAYPKWTYDAWEVGEEDYLTAPFVRSWADNYSRQIGLLKIGGVLDFLANIKRAIKLDLILYILLPVLEVLIVIREGILMLMRKEGQPGLGGLALALFGLFAAIVFAMPAGLRVYFHAYYFMSLLLVGIYLLTIWCARKEKKNQGAGRCANPEDGRAG